MANVPNDDTNNQGCPGHQKEKKSHINYITVYLSNVFPLTLQNNNNAIGKTNHYEMLPN